MLTAFFASPFANNYRWIRESIADACRQHDVNLRAVDEVVTPGASIIDSIHAEIESCDFAFAVLTGNNPNVFYELGRLLQASKPTILLLSKDGLRSIPFDVRAYSILTYDDDDRNLRTLTNAIGNAIGRLKLAFDPATRSKSLETASVNTKTNTVIAIDFEGIRKEAERRLGKSDCKTTDITTHDTDDFKGWNQTLDCPCGDLVIIVIDLNGEIKRVRTR